MKGKNTLLGIVASSGILLSCNSNLKTEIYNSSNESLVEKRKNGYFQEKAEKYATKRQNFEEYNEELREEIIPHYEKIVEEMKKKNEFYSEKLKKLKNK
tara:strand:- start:248 stop:544 length:297 start_codon:yes stop_codon:yes gene_type:complete